MIRKTVTLFLLTLYLSSAVTLDLHHNHSSHLPGSTAPAVVDSADISSTTSSHHAPCPVQQFSLSHAPVSMVELDAVFASLAGLHTTCLRIDSRLVLTPSERAPPVV